MFEPQGLKCPKCNKNGLVRCEHSEHDVFQCLYCGYRQDLTTNNRSKSSASEELGAFLIALFAGFFIVFGLLLP
ncbi:MAG: hypothetical protein F6K58_07175 [Symploca sp. SIO2E9]|nr:hypothetical protein [Symploca sp. SIO2E9]